MHERVPGTIAGKLKKKLSTVSVQTIKRKLDLNIDQLFVIIKTDHSESQEDYQNSRKVGRNQLTSENKQLVFESQIG